MISWFCFKRSGLTWTVWPSLDALAAPRDRGQARTASSDQGRPSSRETRSEGLNARTNCRRFRDEGCVPAWGAAVFMRVPPASKGGRTTGTRPRSADQCFFSWAFWRMTVRPFLSWSSSDRAPAIRFIASSLLGHRRFRRRASAAGDDREREAEEHKAHASSAIGMRMPRGQGGSIVWERAIRKGERSQILHVHPGSRQDGVPERCQRIIRKPVVSKPSICRGFRAHWLRFTKPGQGMRGSESPSRT